MIDINIAVTGDREVAVKFDELPKRAHDRILARIIGLTDRLLARVRGAAPDKTGKLRGEITSRIYDDAGVGRITGRVFIAGGLPKNEYAKAAALEYGAHGTVSVRDHLERRNKVFGREIAPMMVMVRRHSRRIDITAERFLRDPIGEMSAEAVAEIRAAVEEAIND
jgi:hypothetical protein